MKHNFIINSVKSEQYPIETAEYPFSLVLPENIPSSFEYSTKNAKARITYEVWAGLMNKKKK